jgi:MerR family transcriptional regulator, thiopeptide resistance regulator
MYLIRQFANLAGVTVRTLHHYDRLGLLSPKQRTESGYRLYTNHDLVRLERITVLRYLGLSLRQIAEMLSNTQHGDLNIADLLQTQAIILRERRDGISRVLRAVEAAERSLDAAHTPDWQLFKSIIKEVSMQDSAEWPKKYYSESALQLIEQNTTQWTPEQQQDWTRQWNDLFAKVEAAIAADEDPTAPNGRELAHQWHSLVALFTQGDSEVQRGLSAMYNDMQNWPEKQQQQHAVKPEILDFIRRASAAWS